MPPSECERNYGQPGTFGFFKEVNCLCPSSDAGCACSKASDCEGECLAPSSASCTNVTAGTCSSTILTFGCVCRVRDDRFNLVCTD